MRDFIYTIIWKSGETTGSVVSGDSEEAAVEKAVQCCRLSGLQPLVIVVSHAAGGTATLAYVAPGHSSGPAWKVAQFKPGGKNFAGLDLQGD